MNDASLSDSPILSLYYRGVLSSCNYACSYCPFAKKKDNARTLDLDAKQLKQFVNWVGSQRRKVQILFTPWGEALVRKHYRVAVSDLALLPGVQHVAVQTNLSGSLSWLSEIPAIGRKKIGLWCTYHPTEVSLERFSKRCHELSSIGVAHSVGMVAHHAHLPEVKRLRAAIPISTKMWLNALSGTEARTYSGEELELCRSIDPFFDFSANPRPSKGQPCRAGSESLSIDEFGDIRRCHFLPQILGNIVHPRLEDVLREEPCTRRVCDCFIGYSQRRDFPIFNLFGEGLMARMSP